MVLEEELIIKSGDVGESTVSRKGVKACVVLERGAMFKFPDDSRKRYFNALDCLPSNVIASFAFQRKERPIRVSGSVSVTSHF